MRPTLSAKSVLTRRLRRREVPKENSPRCAATWYWDSTFRVRRFSGPCTHLDLRPILLYAHGQKVEVSDEFTAISYSARHTGHVDSADCFARACARLWHRAKTRADIAIRCSGQSRLPVSRTSQVGTQRMAQSQMETIGNRTRG